MRCVHCGQNIRPYGSAPEIWTVGGGWGSACSARKIGAGYGKHELDMSDPKAVEEWLGAS